MSTAPERAPREFMDEVEAGELLGISPRTLQAWRVRGTAGPRFCKIGRSVRYRRRDIEAWLADHTHTHTAEAAQ